MMARSEVYSDIEPGELRQRIEAAHAVLVDGEEPDPIDWFRAKVGRNRRWLLARLRGDSQLPLYAETVLEQVEMEAEVRKADQLLPARRQERASDLADEIREIREALRRHLRGLLETLERGERAMRRLAGERRRVEFGDRQEETDEAREMARKGG